MYCVSHSHSLSSNGRKLIKALVFVFEQFYVLKHLFDKKIKLGEMSIYVFCHIIASWLVFQLPCGTNSIFLSFSISVYTLLSSKGFYFKVRLWVSKHSHPWVCVFVDISLVP